jgi:hypothetical protein
VQDECPVRVFHGGTHQQEKAHTTFNREPAIVSKLRDSGPLYIFHYQIGSFVFRAAVEQLRDVGVMHPCQDLPLASLSKSALARGRMKSVSRPGRTTFMATSDSYCSSAPRSAC